MGRFWSCLWMFCLVLSVQGYGADASTTQLHMVWNQHNYGYPNALNQGIVTIDTEEEAFKGLLGIQVGNQTYQKQIVLPSPGKHAIPMAIYLDETVVETTISLLQEDQYVASVTEPVQMLRSPYTVTGIAADLQGASMDFAERVMKMTGQTNVVVDVTNQIQGSLNPLSNFDVLVLDSVQEAQLNQAEKKALEQWMKRGGKYIQLKDGLPLLKDIYSDSNQQCKSLSSLNGSDPFQTQLKTFVGIENESDSNPLAQKIGGLLLLFTCLAACLGFAKKRTALWMVGIVALFCAGLQFILLEDTAWLQMTGVGITQHGDAAKSVQWLVMTPQDQREISIGTENADFYTVLEPADACLDLATQQCHFVSSQQAVLYSETILEEVKTHVEWTQTSDGYSGTWQNPSGDSLSKVLFIEGESMWYLGEIDGKTKVAMENQENGLLKGMSTYETAHAMGLLGDLTPLETQLLMGYLNTKAEDEPLCAILGFSETEEVLNVHQKQTVYNKMTLHVYPVQGVEGVNPWK